MDKAKHKQTHQEAHAEASGADQATQQVSGRNNRAGNHESEQSQRPWLRWAGGTGYLVDGIVS